MTSTARFTFPADPEKPDYLIEKDDIFVGRSPNQCDFVITGDRTISRLQAKVSFQDGRYVLKSLGQNETLINDGPVGEHILSDGDEIRMGQTVFKFESGAAPIEEEVEEEVEEEAKKDAGGDFDDEKTYFVAKPAAVQEGPRLVLTDPVTGVKAFYLDQDEFFIGRGADVDARLEDSSVSRLHCLIVRREDAYWARNLSETNPVLVNDKEIGSEPGSEKRLYSGDRIGVGNLVLSFVSDRMEDTPPVGEKQVVTQMKGAGWAVWALAVVLLLVVAGYGFFVFAYKPWRIEKDLEQITQTVKSGQYEQARMSLETFLKQGITPEQKKTAQELLAKSTLAVADRMIQGRDLAGAESYIQKYLRTHGGNDAASPLRDKRDEINLFVGQEYEDASQYEMALKQYALIDQESPYFQEAQAGMRRIWMAFQQRALQDKTLAQLLEKAENSFIEKKYLTPVNENAYSAYKAVLEIDPNNATAMERIEQMKRFYYELGEKYFKRGDFNRARTYFERYNIIDPDNPDVMEKLKKIRKGISAKKPAPATRKEPPPSSPPPEQKQPATAAETRTSAEKHKEIEGMLEESGKESTWIMKYLFEDKEGEKEGEKEEETPWK